MQALEHQPVTVDVSTTHADLMAFDRWFKSGPQFDYFRRYRWACTGAGVTGGFAVMFTSRAAGLWMVASLSAIAIINRLTCKRNLDMRVRSINYHFVVDERGLTAHRPGMANHVEWGAVKEITVSGAYLFVRAGESVSFIIPKRCLRDPADAQRIVDFRVAARAVGAATSTPPPPDRP
jgi:hypothetical protein